MVLTEIVNGIFGTLVLIAQGLSVILIVLLFVKRPSLQKPIAKWGFFLAFSVALGTVVGSLIYSEVIGYEPCKLCWLQRIFMFPLPILLGIALVKKDHRIADYAIALSLLGALLAAYHYLLQLGFAPAFPCAAEAVSCVQKFVNLYGYISIPMMAFSSFVLITLLLYSHKRFSSNLPQS